MAGLHYPTSLADDVVRLRPWADGDLGCVEQAARDPRIVEATSVPADYTREAGLAFVRRQHERLTAGQGWALAVADHETDEALGFAGLMLRPQPGVAGIGYWVVPRARGRGLAVRAVGLLTGWALTSLVRVEAWVEPDNAPSRRVLEANGFEREGLLRSFLVLGTRRVDVLVYSRLRGGGQVPGAAADVDRDLLTAVGGGEDGRPGAAPPHRRAPQAQQQHGDHRQEGDAERGGRAQ